MSSEGNNMNEATSYQQSEPVLCANGCGFFGTAATNDLCSKCYNSLRLQEEQQAAAKVVLDQLVNPVPFVAPILVKSSTTEEEEEDVVEKKDDDDEATAAVASTAAAAAMKTSNRCLICKKKVGVMGFNCRCGCTFCGVHRYPEMHDCSFDFKGQGREDIAKANPIVKGEKIQRF